MRALLPLAVVVAVAASAACGVPSEPKKQADEVASVAAEGALLAHDGAAGDSASAFVRTHADALRKRLAALRPKIAEPALVPVADETAAALELLAEDPSAVGVAARLERASARADDLTR
jgi:hypothetical protein